VRRFCVVKKVELTLLLPSISMLLHHRPPCSTFISTRSTHSSLLLPPPSLGPSQRTVLLLSSPMSTSSTSPLLLPPFLLLPVDLSPPHGLPSRQPHSRQLRYLPPSPGSSSYCSKLPRSLNFESFARRRAKGASSPRSRRSRPENSFGHR